MATEVFNRIGEEEIHSENPNSYKRQKEENDEFESLDKIESESKPITEAKKEFFEHLEDDSLTIDACSRLNHEWRKK